MNIKPICNIDFANRYQYINGYITDTLTNKKITNNKKKLSEIIKIGMLNGNIYEFNTTHKNKIKLLDVIV
jgi:hypothetical protein